jgi:8-oxo-dGTP diphosphatase
MSEGLKKIASMVILRNESKYLLMKRAKEPNIGKYLPVGGKLEPFETPRACAIRETYEETGISISEPKFYGTLVETSPTKYNWMVFVYVADVDYTEALECDEGKLEWIEDSDLDNIPTPASDFHIYQYIKEDKNFAFCASYDEQLNLLEMRDEIRNQLLSI